MKSENKLRSDNREYENRILIENIAEVLAQHLKKWAKSQKQTTDLYDIKRKKLNWKWVMRGLNNSIIDSNLEDVVHEKLKNSELDVSTSWD